MRPLYAMMKAAVIVALLTCLSTATAQSHSCRSGAVIKEVIFEDATQVTATQAGSLKKAVAGQCIRRESIAGGFADDVARITEHLRQQLNAFGYRYARVEYPYIRLLDASSRPEKVAMVFAFTVSREATSNALHPR